MTSPTPTYRPAARVLLLDEQDRLLLFRVSAPLELKRPLWITPGGGLEDGESFEEAACRELREETGLVAEAGPCVWTRRHIFTFQGRLLDEVERFFVVRCAGFDVSRDGWLPHEHAFMDEHRWWTLDDIISSDDYFAPRSLGELLPSVLAGDYPPEPVDAGV